MWIGCRTLMKWQIVCWVIKLSFNTYFLFYMESLLERWKRKVFNNLSHRKKEIARVLQLEKKEELFSLWLKLNRTMIFVTFSREANKVMMKRENVTAQDVSNLDFSLYLFWILIYNFFFWEKKNWIVSWISVLK